METTTETMTKTTDSMLRAMLQKSWGRPSCIRPYISFVLPFENGFDSGNKKAMGHNRSYALGQILIPRSSHVVPSLEKTVHEIRDDIGRTAIIVYRALRASDVLFRAEVKRH